MWTEVSNMGPGVRQGASLAYHPAGARPVLFAADANLGVGETWEWDGELWSMAADSGPLARHRAALIDAGDGSVLLFGGQRGAQPLGDTWSWDGSLWTQVEDSGPSARAGATVATDPATATTLLFGGDGAPSETWSWDGVHWTRVHDNGPALREPKMVLDRASGHLTLFGSAQPGERWLTYIWAQNMWVQVADMGPTAVPRFALSAPSATLAYAYETWSWDGAARRWTEVQDMGPESSGIVGTWDEARGHGIAFDGLQGGRTWRLAARP